MNKKTQKRSKYEIIEKEREKIVNKILKSPSKKKIVVGGPGTGKTYLFERILSKKSKSLTLTFVNALVEDLSLELCGLTTVKTLHSYAQNELSRLGGSKVKIYPKLSEVIKKDAEILLGKSIKFDKIFHDRDDKNKYINFYKKRKDYYNHYGYSDVIFGIVKLLERSKDKVPGYDQIVVDEFQDFNKLEVSLIKLLSEKSPILLVGDDDQALYEDLKDASPNHIRQIYYEKKFKYKPFILPYCSRCTRVIVQVVNDVIETATKKGFLKTRIKKPFKYFNDENKDVESDRNSKIIYCQVFDRAIPWYIQDQLDNIAKIKRSKFTVLIISPIRKKSESIVKSLKKKGLVSIEFTYKDYNEKPILLEGLKLLLESDRGNLGWRIVSQILLPEKEFVSLIKETNKKNPESIVDIISTGCKKEVKKMLSILRGIKQNKTINKNDLRKIFKKIKIEPDNLAKNLIRDDMVEFGQQVSNPGLKKIPIKATTIQSSKGLSADYVFITHFDDRYFIKNKNKTIITDQEICNFIVALARARTKVFLISSTEKQPTFLQWINKDRIEEQKHERLRG